MNKHLFIIYTFSNNLEIQALITQNNKGNIDKKYII